MEITQWGPKAKPRYRKSGDEASQKLVTICNCKLYYSDVILKKAKQYFVGVAL